MFLVSVCMGFRRNQVVRFNVKKIFWKERFYLVHKDKTKSGNRPVPIPFELYYHLKEYYERFKEAIDEANGYFFYTSNGFVTENEFYRKWEQYSKILNINGYATRSDGCNLKELSLHSFRSFYAVYLLDKGVNAFIVMELGGWKNFNSMIPYMRMAIEAKKKAVFRAFDGYDYVPNNEHLRLLEDTPILEKINVIGKKNLCEIEM